MKSNIYNFHKANDFLKNYKKYLELDFNIDIKETSNTDTINTIIYSEEYKNYIKSASDKLNIKNGQIFQFNSDSKDLEITSIRKDNKVYFHEVENKEKEFTTDLEELILLFNDDKIRFLITDKIMNKLFYFSKQSLLNKFIHNINDLKIGHQITHYDSGKRSEVLNINLDDNIIIHKNEDGSIMETDIDHAKYMLEHNDIGIQTIPDFFVKNNIGEKKVINKSNIIMEKKQTNVNEIPVTGAEDVSKKEAIKGYFENYTIDPEKALSHKDIYAFLNKSTNVNGLKNLIKETIGKDIQIKIPSTKAYILKNIVYPIKELQQEKSFKTALNSLVSVDKDLEIIEQNTQKKSFSEVRDFYLSYDINPENKLGHHDIYAFKVQFGKGGKNALETITSLLLENNVEITKNPNKKEVLEKIIYPIKNENKEIDFKANLLSAIDMKENLDLSLVKSMKDVEYIEHINGLNFPEIEEEFELAHFHKLILQDNFMEVLDDIGLGVDEELFSDIKQSFENGKVDVSFKSNHLANIFLKEIGNKDVRQELNNALTKSKSQSI